VRRALELTRLSRENRYLRAELQQRHALVDIVATSDSMADVLDLVRRAARSPATVLITGESGTGKELVARAVHFHSDRVAGPFVAVNCKAFAEGLLESELFGHERGAYTGADRSRKGLFEEANGGTLFLDEIGEISDSFQAKLLRVLQEREIRRIGDDRVRAVDVRIVVATNRDLRKDVSEGRFREDLFFGLAVIPIRIPPLRERPEDILPLARHFLVEHERGFGRASDALPKEVETILLSHSWPGNVRELENAIERAVVLSTTDTLQASDLLLESPDHSDADDDDEPTLKVALDQATKAAIAAAFDATGGAKNEAARRLAIDRTTLYRLIRKYNLESSI
jgi:transcriptional regulator with PAS, ATPase and Fis domain